MNFHDATRQLDYIRQSLSENKKHLGFFLGAGCPLAIIVERTDDAGLKTSEAIIPDVAGLTELIEKRLIAKKTGEKCDYERLADLFIEDDRSNFNIEDVLSTIRSMSQVVGKGEVRGFKSDQLEELDKAICEIISDIVNKTLPSRQSPYHDLAIWARSLKRESPVHVFTTNYDLLMEEALEDEAAPYFDGFVGARNAFFDLGAVENEKLLMPRWLRLWKIHGSINWKLVSDEKSKTVSVVRSDTVTPGQKHLIYPSHLKFDQSRKMPYLAMMDRLKDFLLCPSSILFISGYSFSDDHINDIVVSSLKANPSAMVYAFLYGPLDNPAYCKAAACGGQTPNLVIAAEDRAVIGRNEAEWRYADSTESQPVSMGIVELLEEETDENEGRLTCKFHLGDFAKLGVLLKSLSRNSMTVSGDE